MQPTLFFDEYIGEGRFSMMQDEKIVELYWQKDETAIKETQQKYDRYLYKIAYNILADREDSKESVNDTYLGAWNSMPPHKPVVLATYLGKLTRRISIDVFRKKNREKRRESQYAVSLAELEECISVGDVTAEEVDAKVLGNALNRFLQGISEEARHTFIGRYYFCDSVKEVAAYCGMSESKAKSLLYRTRQELKVYLEKEGYVL